MAFNLQAWRETLDERLVNWKARWIVFRDLGTAQVYPFLAAATLWPVAEAVQQGDPTAWMTLGGVVAGVGSNVLANQIQAWKDEADAAQDLSAAVETNPDLRAELDAVLQKLKVVEQAQAALPEEEHAWFKQTLCEELTRLGNLPRYKATLEGDGAIAQGPDARAVGKQGVLVNGDVGGDVVTGERIDTGGAAYVDGDVNTTGGDFVGRDKRTTTITGDGNVVGDNSSSRVVKRTSAEDYAYGIARIVGCCGSEKLQVDNKYVLQTGIFRVIPHGFEAQPFLLPADEGVIEFDITVFAEDMNIEPYWTQSFLFHRDKDYDLLEFRLTPIEAGTKDIKVEYYYRRHWLAQINFKVEVILARKTISD